MIKGLVITGFLHPSFQLSLTGVLGQVAEPTLLRLFCCFFFFALKLHYTVATKPAGTNNYFLRRGEFFTGMM